MSLPTLDNGDERRRGKQGGLPSMPPLEETKTSMPPLGEIPSYSEEVFKEVSTKDSHNENDIDINREIYDEADRYEEERRPLPNVKKEQESEYAEEDDYYPEYEEDLEEEEKAKDKFIDKKKKRLIPFGGKKSKKKILVKSSDFDDRKNVLANTKITQFSIIAIILILFLVGLKNTFLPSHVYTESQIKNFAAEGAGQTGFPSERGQAFVENFMNSYLTLDKSDPTVLEAISYYYGKEGMTNSSYTGLNMNWTSETKQNIVVPPKVFEINLLSASSAQYKISAFVSNTSGEKVVEDKIDGRWLTFSVNLYYDKEKDSLAITNDSPSIIPNKNVEEQTNVPVAKKLGNGRVNKEIYKTISPTIDGFIEAYGKSSIKSHNLIIQYIDDKDDITLYDGFGGNLVLNGSPSEAIKKVVYDTGEEKQGVYEVDITVKWADAAGNSENKKIEYISRYQMGVRTDAEGKFLVTYFKPFEYFESNNK